MSLPSPAAATRLTKLRSSLRAHTLAMLLAALGVFTVIIANTYLQSSQEIRTPATDAPPVSREDTPPFLSVSSLPDTSLNQDYDFQVELRDYNLHDSLTLEVIDLPDGIYKDGCRKRTSHNQVILTCDLKGIARESGTFVPTFILSDDNHTIRKNLILNVN